MSRWIRILLCFSLIFISVTFLTSEVQGQEVDATSAIVIDSENGQILYQHNADQRIDTGSITKLLTAYTVTHAISQEEGWDGDTLVPISDAAYQLSQDYNLSNVPLRQDYNYTLDELMESIAMTLANGSTLALAEFIAGSESEFVTQMVTHLTEWGFDDPIIESATGLADYGGVNRHSALEVASMAYHLLKTYPKFIDYSQKSTGVFKPRTDDAFDMLNYNQMLPGKPFEYEDVLGLMPGYSEQDGASLVTYAEQEDLGIICVILGASSEEARYTEMTELLDTTFRSYRRETVIQAAQQPKHLNRIPIVGGEVDTAPLAYQNDLSLVVPIVDTTPRLIYQFEPNSKQMNEAGALTAPLTQGTIVGTMRVNPEASEMTFLPSAKGNRVSVILSEDVAEASWIHRAWQSLTSTVENTWNGIRRFFIQLFN